MYPLRMITVCIAILVGLGSLGFSQEGTESPNRAEPTDVDSIKNPIPPDKASQDRGRDIFMSRCVVCHGLEGKGDGPHSESLGVPPWDFTQDIVGVSDGYLFNSIKNGGQFLEMPPFEWGLMDDQIWDVVNYLRLLEKGGN